MFFSSEDRKKPPNYWFRLSLLVKFSKKNPNLGKMWTSSGVIVTQWPRSRFWPKAAQNIRANLGNKLSPRGSVSSLTKKRAQRYWKSITVIIAREKRTKDTGHKFRVMTPMIKPLVEPRMNKQKVNPEGKQALVDEILQKIQKPSIEVSTFIILSNTIRKSRKNSRCMDGS